MCWFFFIICLSFRLPEKSGISVWVSQDIQQINFNSPSFPSSEMVKEARVLHTRLWWWCHLQGKKVCNNHQFQSLLLQMSNCSCLSEVWQTWWRIQAKSYRGWRQKLKENTTEKTVECCIRNPASYDSFCKPYNKMAIKLHKKAIAKN